jgi:hypothetical protein
MHMYEVLGAVRFRNKLPLIPPINRSRSSHKVEDGAQRIGEMAKCPTDRSSRSMVVNWYVDGLLSCATDRSDRYRYESLVGWFLAGPRRLEYGPNFNLDSLSFRG